ncbi:unnamed protein product [Ambrosiozyma monospora]|uniref:Unnamed protein product n=1 Tax=Ambrosiozyma monospora TaxID=43982 RepID=A0A9W6YXP3_AMBMO|nr:unnamed protein product [Ambrosiozyma monospora]
MPSDSIVSLLDHITSREKNEFHKIFNALPLDIQRIIATFFFNGCLKDESEYHTEYTDLMIQLNYKLSISIISEEELDMGFMLNGSTVGGFRSSCCYFKQFLTNTDLQRFPIERLDIICDYEEGSMDILMKLIERSRTFVYDCEDLVGDYVFSGIINKVNELTIHQASDLVVVLENISFYYNLNHLIIDMDDDGSLEEYLSNIQVACQLVSEVTVNICCPTFIEPDSYTTLAEIPNLNIELTGLRLTTNWLPYLDILIENKADLSWADLDEYTYSPSTFKKLITYDLTSQVEISCQDSIDGCNFTGKNLIVCDISAATMRNCDLSGLKRLLTLTLNLVNIDLKTLESIPDSVSILNLYLKYNIISIIDPNSKFANSLPTTKKLSLPRKLMTLSTNTPSIFDVFDISSATSLNTLELSLDELGIHQFSKLDEENTLWDDIPSSVKRITIKLNMLITAEESPVVNVRIGPNHMLTVDIQITELVPPSVIHLTSISNPRIIKQIHSIGRPCLVVSGVCGIPVHIRSLNSFGPVSCLSAHYLIISNRDSRGICVKNTDLVKTYDDLDGYEEDVEIEDIFLQRGFEMVKKYSEMILFKAKLAGV